MAPLWLFLKGILLGFAIAAPVGPIGLLCINRTLAAGALAGLTCGLGAATADAFYGAVAGFGLTAVSSLLLEYKFAIRLVGGAFLIWLGVNTFRKPVAKTAAGGPESNTEGNPAVNTEINTAVNVQGNAPTTSTAGLLAAYTSTTFLTLTNPATILSFAALFASVGLGTTNSGYWGATNLVAGVFLGSTLWWLILCGGVSLARRWATPERMVYVNRASGVMLAAFGVYAIIGAF